MAQITGWPTTQAIATTDPAAAQLVSVDHSEPQPRVNPVGKPFRLHAA